MKRSIVLALGGLLALPSGLLAAGGPPSQRTGPLTIFGEGSSGPVGGMSIGGVTLRDANTSVLALLSPQQVADVKAGTAALDLSAALNAGFNNCQAGAPPRTFRFTSGRYGVKAMLLANTCPVNIILDSGAVIVQTAVFNTVPNVPQAVLSLTGAAAGSSVTGPGTIDGNRANLIGAFSQLPTIPVYGGTRVTGQEQDCVLAQYVDDLTISGITTRNCISAAYNITATNGVTVSNIKIKDSSKAAALQSNNQFVFENVIATNITNQVNGTPIPIFNYAFETRDLARFRVSGLRLSGYKPIQFMTPGGVGIGDPVAGGYHGESLSNGTIDDVQLDGYDFSDARSPAASWGAHFSGVTDVAIRAFKARGGSAPLEINGTTRVTVDNFSLDCNWNFGSGESIGLLTRGGGMTPKSPEQPQDHWTNQPNYDLTISNGIATRCTKGAILASGNLSVNAVRFNGNAVNGAQIWSVFANTATFPGVAAPYLQRLNIANSEARFNGQAGIQINDGIGVNFSGLSVSNNGQEQVGGFGAGVLLFSSGLKDRIQLSGWSGGDDQSFTVAKNASFIPGSTDSKNRFPLVMASGERLAVGQRILIKNGSGAGDINAKIMDIANDVYTVQANGAVTFSEAGNLTNLAGTVSLTAGSQTLSGSGTAFTSAIPGPGYLKVAGQYVKVVRVSSDTSAVIETAATFTATNAAGQMVRADVAGIPSQNHAINAPSGQNISRFSFGPYGSYSAEGNVVSGVTIGDFSSLVDGQELLLEGGVVNANTSNGDTGLLTSFNASAQMINLAYRVKIISPVTYASANAGQIQFLLGYNSGNLPLASLPNTAGAVAGGPVLNGMSPGWMSPDNVFFTARAPATPTGGQYRADLLVRKVGLRNFQ